MQSGKINNHAANVSLRERVQKTRPTRCRRFLSGSRLSPDRGVIRPRSSRDNRVRSSMQLTPNKRSKRRSVQGISSRLRASHLEALISGFNTNVDRDSSEQRCSRVSGEEAFDSLGSFLGGLRRISSAQLASLDSIRDRLIDLRWNPRLTSTGQECQVLK